MLARSPRGTEAAGAAGKPDPARAIRRIVTVQSASDHAMTPNPYGRFDLDVNKRLPAG